MENNVNEQGHLEVVVPRAYPPGYRFMPTDVELITQYLAKRVNNEPIPVAEMSEVNLYRYTPHHLAENYPQLGDKERYFFTPRDRKYPNGNRPKRSVEGVGYWKATGADKLIHSTDGELIGKKKALVFYLGKPKSGVEQKTNWIMHEYKLNTPSRCPGSNDMRLDDWVLCRIYEKPTRSNKKQKDEVVDHGHVSDDDDGHEDQENVVQENAIAAQLVENGNVESLASLHIQDIQDNQIAVYNNGVDNSHDHNQFHQFQQPPPPDYYNPYGFSHDPMPMEAVVPNNNLYGQNGNLCNPISMEASSFGYGVPCHDQKNYLNEQQQASWTAYQHQQDYWGNFDPSILSSYFSDIDDPNDDKAQMAPKRKRN